MSPDCIGPGAGEHVDNCARVGAGAVSVLGAGQEDTAGVVEVDMAGTGRRALLCVVGKTLSLSTVSTTAEEVMGKLEGQVRGPSLQ